MGRPHAPRLRSSSSFEGGQVREACLPDTVEEPSRPLALVAALGVGLADAEPLRDAGADGVVAARLTERVRRAWAGG